MIKLGLEASLQLGVLCITEQWMSPRVKDQSKCWDSRPKALHLVQCLSLPLPHHLLFYLSLFCMCVDTTHTCIYIYVEVLWDNPSVHYKYMLLSLIGNKSYSGL